jgi:hypothetical protein
MMNYRDLPDRRSIKIPNTEKVVSARFLDGKVPRWDSQMGTRNTLAAWMTGRQNPYFARAGANRVWAHFFGVGLIDPVDDANDMNPASHPELLDDFAQAFAGQNFDVKFLIRAITASNTYQRTSTVTHPSQQKDPRLFSHMLIRGLSPEQLFDSLACATMYNPSQPVRSQPFDLSDVSSPRAQFLAKFSDQQKRTDYHTSILQALALMNGKFIDDATSVDRSGMMISFDAPHLRDNSKRVTTLYRSTLSRDPRPEELSRLVAYIDSGGPKKDQKAASADVFWALLNSAEFMLNH